jgi:hypothetical protein
MFIIYFIQFTEAGGKKYVDKSSFRDWVFNEFPQLFYGYHNWFLKTIKKCNLFYDKMNKNTNVIYFK